MCFIIADIDECATEAHQCITNSICLNTISNYLCACEHGNCKGKIYKKKLSHFLVYFTINQKKFHYLKKDTLQMTFSSPLFYFFVLSKTLFILFIVAGIDTLYFEYSLC